MTAAPFGAAVFLRSKGMKHYTDILFDLDGTLTDSSGGITDCFRRAMTAFGYPCPSAEELKGQIIGPPIEASMLHYGVAEETVEAMTKEFRVHYNDHGWCNNRVYDGIPELLKRLYDGGFRLSLATSKPEHFAKRIMEHFDLAQYFYGIHGALPHKDINAKEAVMANALADLPENAVCLMVGDRKHDMEGAAYHGLDAAGVLFGFGSREELAAFSPVFLAETPTELGDWLLEKVECR